MASCSLQIQSANRSLNKPQTTSGVDLIDYFGAVRFDLASQSIGCVVNGSQRTDRQEDELSFPSGRPSSSPGLMKNSFPLPRATNQPAKQRTNIQCRRHRGPPDFDFIESVVYNFNALNELVLPVKFRRTVSAGVVINGCSDDFLAFRSLLRIQYRLKDLTFLLLLVVWMLLWLRG